jgi:hypothetical protein
VFEYQLKVCIHLLRIIGSHDYSLNNRGGYLENSKNGILVLKTLIANEKGPKTIKQSKLD